MKKSLSRVIFGFVLTLSGCVPTLHPLYTDKDLVFDPALVGTWSEADSKEIWTFQKEGDTAYRLIYTDSDGKSGRFVAHLLKIGEARFLDLFPENSALEELNQNAFFKFHLFPVHTFAKISTIEPVLKMAFPDPKWLEEQVSKNPQTLRHEKIEDRILVTASTQDLQEFVRKNADTKGLFGESSNLKRKEK